MNYSKPFQQGAIFFFILLFLADAINVDELLSRTSIEREDDLGQLASSDPATTDLGTISLQHSFSFSSTTPKAPKLRMEIVDVDSPFLEAAYVSRDAIMLFIQETDKFTLPVSAPTELNFYSLCRIQI
jgi:hypothetical protein